MAGMDWFRWHHGSVNDPKFQLVARKAKSSLAEVIAVWATLLEAASLAEDRGNPGELDYEAIDCALGLEDGKAKAIHEHMAGRGMIDSETGRLTSWDKRQPKREREDNTNAERQKAFRERQNQVTPSNAASRQKTPREEKSREEKSREDSKPTSEERGEVNGTTEIQNRPPPPSRKGIVCGLLRKAGMSDAAPSYLPDETWAQILAKRTDEEIVEVARAKMAVKPGVGLKYIAPALLADPESPPARASPCSPRDVRKAAVAASLGMGAATIRQNEKVIEGECHAVSAGALG